MERPHLIVIGGGAAGFFCAVTAARLNPHLQVTIVEKSSKLLSKVRVSGGGRCNVTHSLFEIGEMSRRYPRGQNFVKKTFHQFFTTDTIQWFEERGVRLKAESDGRMFPVTDSSETIVACLMAEANRFGVVIRLNTSVSSLEKKGEGFVLQTGGGPAIAADYVCIACGGYPKSVQFDWLRELGHTVADPVPSLFTFNLPGHPISTLMGVSAKARVKIEGSKLVEEGPVLVTHWGLSGPAILRLSAWGARELFGRDYSFRVHLNWVPGQGESDLKNALQNARAQHPSMKVVNHNFTSLPSRLWQFLLEGSGIPAEGRFADLPARAEKALIRNLTDYTVEVKGKTTFKEEFVTAGGIALGEIDPNTLMSRVVPNLFFAGEIMDVDGITGGFNFQNAWTTGWIAGKTVAALCREVV